MMHAFQNRLLVTGASGFIGSYICRWALKSNWQVFGTYHSHKTTIPGVRMFSLDLTDPAQLMQRFNEIKPHAVIHTAALSKPDACERDITGSAAINVDAAVDLATHCAKAGCPYVFTSTDLVFDGAGMFYKETDPPHPINTYGRHKRKAEIEIGRRYPDAAICRMPLMFGLTDGNVPNFTEQMIVAITGGKPLTLFYDEYRTPVDADSAAQGLLMALAKFKGIIHLGGTRRVSRLEMGRIVERHCGVIESKIQPLSQHAVSTTAKRAADVSMDSSRAFAAGFNPTPVEVALKKMIARHFNAKKAM